MAVPSTSVVTGHCQHLVCSCSWLGTAQLLRRFLPAPRAAHGVGHVQSSPSLQPHGNQPWPESPAGDRVWLLAWPSAGWHWARAWEGVSKGQDSRASPAARIPKLALQAAVSRVSVYHD